MKTSLFTLSLLGFAGLTASTGMARAQTSFPEVEPNGQKSEATLANGMTAGDALTGTSTGSATGAGNSTLASADTFRVKTAALPLGIYRHALALTSSGTTPTAEILGVQQLNGVIQGTETTFQFSETIGGVANSNVWYGFGKQEELYYRVSGTGTTTTPYSATLTTTPVTPVQVAGAFLPGNITVTTVGQGHFSDTEIYVYDGQLNPIPLGHNDGLSPNDATVSTVVLTLGAGTYYVAVSTFNTSNNQSDLNPMEFWDDDALLDFPNVMANTDYYNTESVQFAVSDGMTTTQVPAMHVASFDIAWARFTIGNSSTAYCFGDGTGTACPCGNSGASGNGCASSINPNGAHLTSAGSASISADTFVLQGSGMPNSSALYYQGTTQTSGGAGAAFGDGLRCASGSVIRLGTKVNAGGSSSYPTGPDTPISVRGSNTAGAVRDYQCWYRNAAAFCTPSTFNLTNGVQVTWMP
jgi:hypothetical protein